ncbi:hypothetical protein T265_05656 [Opisthorchis viverrini]|uniref:Uncharacterized protein n=1 Tax=Opisthorchis viverrini TaxID=6198 RepID=A0A074ZNC6_OPIVI|nr:hypothetical protein T265_05656 [Opisthorchis viverrini]KER27252.1 hypothetical protein T265_05656 [Opisthorchis viverrini]
MVPSLQRVDLVKAVTSEQEFPSKAMHGGILHWRDCRNMWSTYLSVAPSFRQEYRRAETFRMAYWNASLTVIEVFSTPKRSVSNTVEEAFR